MSFSLLALLALCAGNPTPVASSLTEPALWPGIPLQSLPALGLEGPILALYESGWQAAIAGGGFVRVTLLPGISEARVAFEEQARSASSLLQPPLSEGLLAPGVQAVGDGAHFLVFRDRNVVCVVTDPAGGALSVARKLHGALEAATAGACAGVLDERALDGARVRWDLCGWRVGDAAQR